MLRSTPASRAMTVAQPPLVEEVAQQPSRNPATVTVSPSYVVSQRPLLTQLHALLTATAGRAPQFGCFGLHEWAMVHRASELGTRHDWPLRLGQEGTDAVVESHRIGCSHFDAFRFFTPTRPPAQHAAAGARRPARVRAAGLPARRDGPLQARLPAHADDPERPGRRLLRPRARHPGPRHARGAVRPRGPRLRAGQDRDGGGQGGVRRGAACVRASAGHRCERGSSRSASGCSR